MSARSRPAERIIDGTPVAVIQDGRILGPVLEIERLPRQEVLTYARQAGIRDLDEIELAVLAPDGRFSFLKRKGGGDDQPPARKDHPE